MLLHRKLATTAHLNELQPAPFPANIVAKPAKDAIQRDYRHLLWTNAEGVELKAPVEVLVRTHLERSAGEYVLGDLVYTLTLLPGEHVQIFSTDRRTRFSVDSTTNIGFHTAATFEDHMYISSMDSFFGQLNASQWAHAESGTSGSFKAHGETSNAFESFFSGPEADMNGSFNVNSFADFVGGMSAQASAAHHMSATATNTASAVTVGAVGARSNIEGKVDTHVEMNYRSFRNPSRTRAVTFYFFQIRRMHRVRFWVDSITVSAPERTMFRLRPKPESGAANGRNVKPSNLGSYADFRGAHAVVTKELHDRKLIAPSAFGFTTPENVRTLTTFDHEFSLATPGLYVRGARDIADVADPSIFRELSNVGGVIADEVEGLAISFIERLGAGIVPLVSNTVAAAQAIISGANASVP